MNSHPLRRKAGFTLIELLVVIVIIAVLAGLAVPITMDQLQKAKKTTARATCVSIEQAVNNFNTEYGAMPSSATEDSTLGTTSSIANLNFVNVLLGKETVPSPLNVRGLKFLSVSDGKASGIGGINGLVYDSAGTTLKGIFDPWGGTYNVRLDGDYDEKITVKPKATDSVSVILNRRVAAWSDGADGVSAAGKSADDVTTW